MNQNGENQIICYDYHGCSKKEYLDRSFATTVQSLDFGVTGVTQEFMELVSEYYSKGIAKI